MTPPTLRVSLHGPFQWLTADAPDYLFSSEVVDHPGIYLWTVPHSEGDLVYYVGETGRPFRQRLQEHVVSYLAGMYRIYDPAEFAEGRKELLWPGMSRKPGLAQAAEYLERSAEIAPALRKLLGLLRFNLLPFEGESRPRKRIEAAIALHLRAQPGVVGAFQESDIHYSGKTSEEEPPAVEFVGYETIQGLAASLQA
ncbi:MAG: hypothetical protein O7H41_00685 [Planctomycetota bacterium]|nr:hypothetical protein [Planctomycetota bacterium]